MRIGVYVCHCGSNIAGFLDVESVRKHAESLKNVVVARTIPFACGDIGQEHIKTDIIDLSLDRVVVAACSPRIHEITFRRVLERAGLNPCLLEIVNIREHCSWVHMTKKPLATQKAKDLVSMGVAKAALLAPMESELVQANRSALIIGGGVAGIHAALDLAESMKVYLVEREPTIGGKMVLWNEVFPTNDCSSCVLAPKMTDVANHPNIELLTNTEIRRVTGNAGNFNVTCVKKPRYVDEDKCKGCIQECAGACPVSVPSDFDFGIGARKAIFLPIQQAVPLVANIDMDYCVGCDLCRQACPADAVDYKQKKKTIDITTGAIIVATGWQPFDASRKEEYGYGIYKDVVTTPELERMLNTTGPTHGQAVRPSSGEPVKKVAFIQCVGSRDEQVGNPYCSKICCMVSIKNAQLIKEKNPDTEITIFYIDVRAAGEMYEEYYLRAQDMGIDFIRGRGGEIIEKDGTVFLRYEDTLNCETREEPFDLIALSVGMEPNQHGAEVVKMLNLPRRTDRFIQIGHPKMRPVDTHIRGIYVAGAASGPKEIQVAVEQGTATAAKVMNLLREGRMAKDVGGVRVDEDLCIGCGLCENVCPYKVVTVTQGKAQVREIMCKGCGSCSGACPTGAIQPRLFSDDQITAQIKEVLEHKSEYPLIIGFLCHWCSYAAADLAGLSRMQYPTNLRPIRVLCSGRVNPGFVLTALKNGADGVIVAGCRLGECHYVHGNHDAKQRMSGLKEILKDVGFEPERLKMAWLSASEGEKFAQIIEDFTEKLKEIGAIGSELKKARGKKTGEKHGR